MKKFIHLAKSIFMSALLTVCMVAPGNAFVLSPYNWPSSSDTFFVMWDSGGQFDTAFIQAMNEWNGQSNFVYTPNTSRFVDPCASVGTPDYESGYRFSPDDCGRGFGASTLAVAWTWFSGANIVDSDIIFNSTRSWGVHDLASSSPFDFRRVAVHELGHSLGLDHEPSNPAIMNPYYSTTIRVPQADDLNGLIAHYGGGPAPDTDGDGVNDLVDNCTLVANPLQRDTDGDGFGNYCDGDFDNNNIVNSQDLFYFKSIYFSTDPDGDINGDGVVNSIDLFLFKQMYFMAPGPSCCAPITG